MEIVLVQLADETGKVAVFEMSGQDSLGEFFALQQKVLWSERNERGTMWARITSKTTKLSPSSPQRTISEYDGSSSILSNQSEHEQDERLTKAIHGRVTVVGPEDKEPPGVEYAAQPGQKRAQKKVAGKVKRR